jgi:RNA polymerase sigma factor (sigma-70 family)
MSSSHADRDAVLRALWQVPPRQRAVLVMRFYEDLSEGDVADTLQISVGTVRSQTFKGLAKLRQLGIGPIATGELR